LQTEAKSKNSVCRILVSRSEFGNFIQLMGSGFKQLAFRLVAGYPV